MSCEPMLMQLLEAEPDELRRLVDTPLTRHLADCPKCAAVADRLIADTAQLAFAVNADAARPARRLSRLWLVPGMAAAAVALLLWRGDATPGGPMVAEPRVVAAPPAPATAAPPVVVAEAPRREAAPSSPRVMPAGRRLRVRPEPQLVAYRVEPVVVTPMPVPVPVSVAPAPLDRLGGSAPSRDQPTPRGTVLRSTVPGVTVIWSNK